MDKKIPNNPHILYNTPIQPAGKARTGVKTKNQENIKSDLSFNRVLQEQLGKGQVSFSGHALERMRRRDLKLTSEQMGKLNSAVEKAARKGARDSLILLDSMAFVVSIKNRTVITAIDGEQMKENVFTNIDSAVIV
jgi:flagellar operon protein